jgi:hypothetical protein
MYRPYQPHALVYLCVFCDSRGEACPAPKSSNKVSGSASVAPLLLLFPVWHPGSFLPFWSPPGANMEQKNCAGINQHTDEVSCFSFVSKQKNGLPANDWGLSRRKQGFETPRGRHLRAMLAWGAARHFSLAAIHFDCSRTDLMAVTRGGVPSKRVSSARLVRRPSITNPLRASTRPA